MFFPPLTGIIDDESDKEAHEFVKRFEKKRQRLEMQYRKREMLAVVSTIITKTMKAQVRKLL